MIPLARRKKIIHPLSSKYLLTGLLTKVKAKEEKKVIKTLSSREGKISTPMYTQFCQFANPHSNGINCRQNHVRK